MCNAFHPDDAAIQTSVARFLDYIDTVPAEVRSRLCA